MMSLGKRYWNWAIHARSADILNGFLAGAIAASSAPTLVKVAVLTGFAIYLFLSVVLDHLNPRETP